MREVLSRRGPLAVLAALAMAFAMALTVFTASANAQTDCVTFETSGSYTEGQVIEVDGITITVTEVNDEGELLAFDFTSETPISTIIVKASTDVDTETYDPPVTSGSVVTPGVGPQGQPQGISNVQFCFGGGTTTTTTGTGTTTTGTDTTTTTGAATTTTGEDIIITDVVKKVGYTKFEGVKKVVYFDTEKKFYFIIVDEKVVEVEQEVVVLTDVASSAEYQYSASASASSTLPDTGGSGLLPLGALVLLLGGGMAAYFAVKRGVIG